MPTIVITRHEVSTYEYTVTIDEDLTPYIGESGSDDRQYVELSELPQEISDKIAAALVEAEGEDAQPDYIDLEIETTAVRQLAG